MIKKFLRGGERGQMAISPAKIVTLVIAIGIGILVADALLLDALDSFAGANTSNLTGQQQTMVDLVPTFGALALALAFVGGAIKLVR